MKLSTGQQILWAIACLLSYILPQTTVAQTHVFAQLNGSPLNTSGWTLNGNAQVGDILFTNNSELILCNATNSQSGAIFFDIPVDASFCKKWAVEFDFRMFDGNGADGLAFCYLDVPPTGFVSGLGLGIPATANGLKVCFDTYPNCSNPASEMPKIEIRSGQGYDECWLQPTLTNTTGNLSFLRSNSYNHAKVTYNDGNIDLYVNNVLYLSGFEQMNFPGYMGFTASTGGLFDNHSIQNVVIYTEMPPSNAGPDITTCRGNSATLGGTNNPAYTYSWTPSLDLSNPAASNPTVTLVNTTNAPVTATYIVATALATVPGCASTDTVQVTVLPENILTPDTTICTPGTIQLRGRDALTYQWTPATGLNNNTIQNPVLTADSTRTYQLTATYYNNNLVDNGDFELGNTGFITGYSYCNTNNCLFPLADNGYAIGNNATLFHTSFTGVDHTNGAGNFMIINGANPNLIVWKQTIAVTPNTTYAFGTWISTLIAVNPASIRFSINGAPLGPVFNAPANPNQWVRYFTQWNSGASTTATIEIVDVFPQANGNDFGLDDIFFAPVISCSDTVRVTVLSNGFNPLPDSVKVCKGPVVLNVGPGFTSYNWNTGATSASVNVTTSGWYQVTAGIGNNCSQKDSSYVLIYPTAVTTVLNKVICPAQSFTLYNGMSVNSTGTYHDTLLSRVGCDSIIRTVNLSVLQPVTNNTTATICNGQVYTLPSGATTNTAGLHQDTIKSIGGCDSIITRLQLIILSPVTRNVNATICSGTVYTLPSGQTAATAGLYRDTLKSNQNCDSVYTLLTLAVTTPVVITKAVAICNGTSYTLPSGVVLSTAGLYKDTLKNIAGCDSSILQLTLTIIQPQINTITQRICTGKTYVLPSGSIVSTPGLYKDTLRSSRGCDSIITQLTLQLIPLSNKKDTVYTCIGQPYTLPSGVVVNLAGNYTSVLNSVDGCDSTIVTTIIKYPPLRVSITASAPVCSGNSATVTAVPSGGNGGPYSYAWTGSAANTAQLTYTPVAGVPVSVAVVDGCTAATATATVTTTVLAKPVAAMAVSPVAGCAPLSVTTTNNSTPSLSNSSTWYWGDGNSTNGNNPGYVYATPGQYRISLKIVNANGCTDSIAYNQAIQVASPPTAAFTYTPAPNLIGNSAIQFQNLGSGAAGYSWSFGDNSNGSQLNPVHIYIQSGNYPVTLIASNGQQCADTATDIIVVKPLDNVYIPSAFTPNGDGSNDVFRVYGIGIQTVKMDIYNRYGSLVFSTTDNPAIWNGIQYNFGIPCDAGNYVYIIQLKQLNQPSKTYKGNILLLK